MLVKSCVILKKSSNKSMLLEKEIYQLSQVKMRFTHVFFYLSMIKTNSFLMRRENTAGMEQMYSR